MWQQRTSDQFQPSVTADTLKHLTVGASPIRGSRLLGVLQQFQPQAWTLTLANPVHPFRITKIVGAETLGCSTTQLSLFVICFLPTCHAFSASLHASHHLLGPTTSRPATEEVHCNHSKRNNPRSFTRATAWGLGILGACHIWHSAMCGRGHIQEVQHKTVHAAAQGGLQCKDYRNNGVKSKGLACVCSGRRAVVCDSPSVWVAGGASIIRHRQIVWVKFSHV